MGNTTNQQEKLASALRYQKMGLSIIPVGPDKKPLVDWKLLQSQSASEEQILNWWKTWPEANPALVTGKVSNVVALDLDAKHGRKSAEFQIPPTASSKSGNGGEHFFFKYPSQPVETRAGIFGLGVDIRGDGGYIILPPSVNATGGKYEWIVPFEDGIAEMPDWLKAKTRGEEKKWLEGINGVSEGTRNDTATSMAGKIISSCSPELMDSVCWEGFKVWNNKNIPPLSEPELRATWESVRRYHTKEETENSGRRDSQADKVIRLIQKNLEVKLFRSELDEPFINFPVMGHKEYWPCKDKRSKWWLASEFWKHYNKSLNNESITTALNTLQGFASFESEKFTLSNRVALKDGEIFYSLSNDEWEAVRIAQDGWSVEKDVPILFRRHTHQTAQVAPQKGGDIWDIFKYVNVKNEEHKIIFLVWLISCFIPDFPHPILYLYGPQGSAKSTASRLLKKIIDPSKIETFEIPKDQKELVQKLSHHWCLMFDNISNISPDLSDLLCRAVTGSGFSKRELYSDDSDVIYTFKRCLSINGVNLLALKPDLLERSILIELERVSKTERRNEQDLMKDFDAELPKLLGAIMDTIASALRLRSSVELKETPRMADFALWGYAIAEALGYGGPKFIVDYYRNVNLQNEEVIRESFIASFVVDLIEKENSWEGRYSELLKLMEGESKDIPKTPQELSRHLNILKTNLEEVGIVIERISGSDRKIIIRRKGESIAPSASLFTEKNINNL